MIGRVKEKVKRKSRNVALQSTTIPDDFLPPKAPRDARSRRIDFTSTDPPLLNYKSSFAAVIDNLFTESECKELLRLAEATTLSADSANAPVWERAMINIGNGKQKLIPDSRNCGRIIWDTPLIAQKLFDRLAPYLREYGIEKLDNRVEVTGQAGRRYVYHLSRLNERLRFLKYEGGEYFRPHCDGCYETPDRQEISFYTIHLYLNDDGEQDLEELRQRQKREANGRGQRNADPSGKLLGGATSFVYNFRDEDPAVRVFPKTGSVLIFQQEKLLHGGDPVFRGTKYTLRTDVMFRKEEKDLTAQELGLHHRLSCMPVTRSS